MAVWMVEDESRGGWLEADRSGICRRRCVGLLLVGYSGRPVCWWRREQLTNSGGCLCIQSRGGDREGRRAGEMKEGMGSVSSREDEGRNGQRRNRLDFLKEKAAATVLEKWGEGSRFPWLRGSRGTVLWEAERVCSAAPQRSKSQWRGRGRRFAFFFKGVGASEKNGRSRWEI